MNENKTGLKSEIITFVFVFLAMMLSGHALFASNEEIHNYIFYFLLYGGLAFVILKKLSCFRNIKWIDANSITLIWILLTLFNYLFNADTEPLMGYFSNCLLLVLAYAYVNVIDFRIFAKKYIQILFVLSIISLVLFYYIQNTPLYAGMPYIRGYGLTGEYNKYQGFLFYYKADLGRNNGMFWEPGIYSSHLIFAISFLPNCNLRHKWIYYSIFYITVISTKSSAGYVLLVLVTLFLLSANISKVKNNKSKIILYSLTIFLALFVVVIYLNLENVFNALGWNNQLVFQKILDTGESSRSYAIEWNLNAFKISPIFGHGYNGLGALSRRSDLYTGTATSFRLLAIYGIGGIFYSYAIIRGWLMQRGLAWISRVLMVVIVLLIVNKEGQDQFLIMWMLIMYSNQSNSLLERNKGNTYD